MNRLPRHRTVHRGPDLEGELAGVGVRREVAVAADDGVDDQLAGDEVLPLEVPVLVGTARPIITAEEDQITLEEAGLEMAVRLGMRLAECGEASLLTSAEPTG